MNTTKEQQIQIDTLEKIIDNQQKQIDHLREAVSAIRSALVSVNDRTKEDHDLLCELAQAILQGRGKEE